mgnify:CR=1 FL=1
MVIAVDFDGTIVEHQYPDIGEERPFATEVLRKLIEERHKLILWTVREGKLLDEALDWCKQRGVEFYAVNSDSSDIFKEAKDRNISCKLNADVFIDDRNICGLPSWTDIYTIISKHRTYEQIIRHRVREEMEPDAEPPYPSWMFWKNSKRR